MFAFVVSLLLASAHAGDAAPTSVGPVLRDASTGFSMELHAPGASICSILPSGGEDAEGCDGIDVAALRASLLASSPPVSAFVVIRQEGWVAQVALMVLPFPLDPNDPASLEPLFEGFKNGATKSPATGRISGDVPGTDYTVVSVDGRPALKTNLEAVGDGGSGHGVIYCIPTDGVSLCVSFNSNAKDTGAFAAMVGASVATAHARPPVSEAALAEAERKKAEGEKIGYVVAGLIAFGVVAYRDLMRHREKTGTSPPP